MKNAWLIVQMTVVKVSQEKELLIIGIYVQMQNWFVRTVVAKYILPEKNERFMMILVLKNYLKG
jgi:hypothetical protein